MDNHSYTLTIPFLASTSEPCVMILPALMTIQVVVG